MSRLDKGNRLVVDMERILGGKRERRKEVKLSLRRILKGTR